MCFSACLMLLLATNYVKAPIDYTANRSSMGFLHEIHKYDRLLTPITSLLESISS